MDLCLVAAGYDKEAIPINGSENLYKSSCSIRIVLPIFEGSLTSLHRDSTKTLSHRRWIFPCVFHPTQSLGPSTQLHRIHLALEAEWLGLVG